VAFAFGGQRNEGARITIKRATDEEAAHIPAKAQKTTIEEMVKLTRPEGVDAGPNGQPAPAKRANAFEKTKWVLDATITEVIKRPDGDFYCVIEGKDGARTVFEAPDPELCTGSHFLDEIKAVRKVLDEKFHPTAQPQKVNVKIQLTGLGFFGYQGKAPNGGKTNGARIMPALNVNFKD